MVVLWERWNSESTSLLTLIKYYILAFSDQTPVEEVLIAVDYLPQMDGDHAIPYQHIMKAIFDVFSKYEVVNFGVVYAGRIS